MYVEKAFMYSLSYSFFLSLFFTWIFSLSLYFFLSRVSLITFPLNSLRVLHYVHCCWFTRLSLYGFCKERQYSVLFCIQNTKGPYIHTLYTYSIYVYWRKKKTMRESEARDDKRQWWRRRRRRRRDYENGNTKMSKTRKFSVYINTFYNILFLNLNYYFIFHVFIFKKMLHI